MALVGAAVVVVVIVLVAHVVLFDSCRFFFFFLLLFLYNSPRRVVIGKPKLKLILWCNNNNNHKQFKFSWKHSLRCIYLFLGQLRLPIIPELVLVFIAVFISLNLHILHVLSDLHYIDFISVFSLGYAKLESCSYYHNRVLKLRLFAVCTHTQ